ncbi:hypothetical protein DVH24_015051 [Malus domestica]|uniref:Uncharacterized protein n=1 Tax=Malus domestica TaxID=3750 RepID=A0A498K8J1_MALDO|nr:hypothetical protein DVH24_015051 [Malus domestica]
MIRVVVILIPLNRFGHHHGALLDVVVFVIRTLEGNRMTRVGLGEQKGKEKKKNCPPPLICTPGGREGSWLLESSSQNSPFVLICNFIVREAKFLFRTTTLII